MHSTQVKAKFTFLSAASFVFHFNVFRDLWIRKNFFAQFHKQKFTACASMVLETSFLSLSADILNFSNLFYDSLRDTFDDTLFAAVFGPLAFAFAFV